MHTRTILAIARKDMIDILKNRQMLFSLLLPIFMAVFFMLVQLLLNNRLVETRVLIYDPDRTLINEVTKSLFSDAHIEYAHSADEVVAAFGTDGTRKDSPYSMGLIVPTDFETSIREEQHPQLILYTNGDHMAEPQRQAIERLLIDYAQMVANPQPAIGIEHTTINPPVEENRYDLEALNSVYAGVILLISFYASLFLLPSLLIEEKEKKTIRTLMVSPASFTDIVLGKALVCLIYQLALTLIVTIPMQAFKGNVPLMLTMLLLGSFLSLAFGLLLGCILKTTTAANGVGGGIGTVVLILSAMLAGPFGELLLSNSPAGQFIKVLPTYYLADAIYIAFLNQDRTGAALLDISIVSGTVIIAFIAAVWTLRRQAQVVASI